MGLRVMVFIVKPMVFASSDEAQMKPTARSCHHLTASAIARHSVRNYSSPNLGLATHPALRQRKPDHELLLLVVLQGSPSFRRRPF